LAKCEGKRQLGKPRLRREDAFSRRGIERHGPDYCGSGQEQVAGACECGNEHSGSIKCGEFLDWLRNC